MVPPPIEPWQCLTRPTNPYIHLDWVVEKTVQAVFLPDGPAWEKWVLGLGSPPPGAPTQPIRKNCNRFFSFFPDTGCARFATRFVPPQQSPGASAPLPTFPPKFFFSSPTTSPFAGRPVFFSYQTLNKRAERPLVPWKNVPLTRFAKAFNPVFKPPGGGPAGLPTLIQ